MFNFQIITDILRNINITLAAILKQFSNLASNSLCFSFSRLVSEVPKEQKTNMKQHRKKKNFCSWKPTWKTSLNSGKTWKHRTVKKPVRLLRRSSTLEVLTPVPDTKAISALNGILAEICISIKNPNPNLGKDWNQR